MLGKGDTIGIAGTYCDGASHYCSNNAATTSGSTNQLSGTLGRQVPGNPALFALTRNGTQGFGVLYDGFYGNTAATTGGGVQKSKTWNVNGGLQHRWNDMWATSLWGAYLKYRANSSVVDTAYCPTVAVPAGAAALGAGCLDFSAWQVGSRTLWNPVVNLDISVEAMYTRVHSAQQGGVAITTASSLLTAGTVLSTFGDVGVWSGILRFQRNFWP